MDRFLMWQLAPLRVERRHAQRGEERRLEQLRLPAERVPRLPDRDDRHVQDPRHEQAQRACWALDREYTCYNGVQRFQHVTRCFAAGW